MHEFETLSGFLAIFELLLTEPRFLDEFLQDIGLHFAIEDAVVVSVEFVLVFSCDFEEAVSLENLVVGFSVVFFFVLVNFFESYRG